MIPKQVWVLSFPLTHKKTEALGSYRPRPECLPTRTAVGQGASVQKRAFFHTWPVELPFNQHQLCALYCSRHYHLSLHYYLAQMAKNPPTMWETWARSLGWENPVEEGMATHSSIFAWRIPMERGAWRATVHGVAKGRTPLSESLARGSLFRVHAPEV